MMRWLSILGRFIVLLILLSTFASAPAVSHTNGTPLAGALAGHETARLNELPHGSDDIGSIPDCSDPCCSAPAGPACSGPWVLPEPPLLYYPKWVDERSLERNSIASAIASEAVYRPPRHHA